MESFWKIFMLAMVTEALTEYVKTAVLIRDWKSAVVQLCALGIGLLVCLAASADLPAELGVPFQVPWLGSVITGILVSRGANYVNDLTGRLRTVKGGNKNG